MSFGVTFTLPDCATVPTPFEIVTSVAFSTCHTSAEDSPCRISSGAAENRTIRGIGSAITWIVTCAVVDPKLFRAVITYVVCVVGITTVFPDFATAPIPEISTVSAFSVCHVSVVDCPAVTFAGVAEKNTIHTSGRCTVTVTVSLTSDVLFFAVSL